MEENPAAAPANRTHILLLVLFLMSGASALIYEMVWFHLLRLVIGASALSLGLLLASFMGGMFGGSLLYARVVPRRISPLAAYAAIEIGIGVMGIALPFVLPLARAAYVGLFGYGAAGIALRAAVAGVMLLPPTALMGATLPAVARRYRADQDGASALAALYGANTIGAVVGCLVTGFYILPRWDVLVATGIAVAVNFTVALIAGNLAKKERALTEISPSAARPSDAKARASDGEQQPPAPLERPSPPKSESPGPWKQATTIYVVIGLSGMTALGAQVVWTRLLALLLGGTIYTFSIILAIFLGGLGIGSAIAAWALGRGHDSRRLLAGTQLALAPAIVYAAFMIAKVIPYTATLRMVPIDTLHLLHVIRCTEVILPASILWGMSFPLALAAAGIGQTDPARSSGHVYAANTLGAIVGSLGTSFLAIPTWGTRAAEQILVGSSAISAAVLYRTLRREIKSRKAELGSGQAEPRAGRSWSDLAFELPLPVALLGVLMVPGLSDQFQATGRYIWTLNERDRFPFVAEGVASTVAVRESNGNRYYHVAGKVEASTDHLDMRLQRLLGHLSALAHPNPRSVLVVGLGAGVTAGSFIVHPEVTRIVICEIEPNVLPAASRYFSAENHAVLDDPRVVVVSDDARHFLATTHEKFDVITSDPIHPWVRGNSVLFSKEYYAIVKERLKRGGIATQWVPLYETSEKAIQIQMQTFLDAFPDGTVWNSQPDTKGYDVVLLGQVEPLRLDLNAIQKRIDDNAALRQSLADVRLGSALDLFASYGTRGPDLGRWLAGTPVNRDFSLKLEYISGLAFNLQIADDIYGAMIKNRSYPDDIFTGAPDALNELRARVTKTSRPAAR